MSLLFIFDMDDVLYGYDWKARSESLSLLTGLSSETLQDLWWRKGSESEAEAGLHASPEAYLLAFNAAIGVDVTESDWVSIRGGAMTPLPESLKAVARAGELGQVTLLTNNGPLAAKHLGTLAPELVPLFGEHLFTSSDYSARKPDPIVFQRVLERYGTPARDAFFADDLPENVAGAESVGITGHLFTTGSELLAAIEEFSAARS
ncbi:HAD-IA family hydrolase [Parafrigoribacterium mesophilum]|uniref:HAD family hydrolase n=1 Tax=Parafrigoribacterium mesophilum TaxID=433646 RepID=UPI0031FC5A95